MKKATSKTKARKGATTSKNRRKVVVRKAAPKAKPAKKAAPTQRRNIKRKIKLPAIGAPFQGGFYAGKFFGADGKPYALIVAPKATGETEAVFKTERGNDAGARSLRDGLANSEAMNDAAHPAAKFCRDLRIGGFDDWYLPSRHEAALLAETLFPRDGIVPEQTSAAAFKEGGAEAFHRGGYWTSTQWDAGFAWVQLFSYGNQTSNFKSWSLRVRAVRKYSL